MRWPFVNWLRAAPGRDDPSPDASEAARTAADPDPGPDPRIVARPAAWRDLPPLQRAVGAAPLTAPSAVFARDLAGRRAPDPMLGPLGHDITADGPAGLVSGIAVPLVQRAPSGSDGRPAPALPAPAAPVRGRPTTQRATISFASGPPTDDPEGAAAVSPLEGAAAAVIAGQAAGGPAADFPSLAPRTLPVARLEPATPALSATRVADATAPAPVLALARIVASGASGAASQTAGSPPVTAPVQVAGAAAGSVPETVPVAPPVLAGGDEPAHTLVARRTLGESRRLGLGAPLTGRPPSDARATDRPDLPVARPTDAPGLTSTHPPIAPGVPAAGAASAPLSRLVVARRQTTATAPEPATVVPQVSPQVSPQAPAAADTSSAGTPVDAPSAEKAAESTASSSASSTRPLVGDSPIGVSRLAREDAATGAATGADADGAADADAAAEHGVPVLRVAGASAALPAAWGPAAGVDAGPEPGAMSAAAISGVATGNAAGPAGIAAVQRSHAMPVGGGAPVLAPLVAGRAIRASLPAAMATLGYGPSAEASPVVARLAIPTLGTGTGGRDERPVVARAALAGGRGPSPTAIPGLPLARSAVGPARPDAVETGRPDGAFSWAAGAGFATVAPPPVPSVQRAVSIDEVTVTPGGDPAGPAESGATAGPAGQPGATGTGGAGTDYEELAEHVYDKIRARLTTELLLDRERAGMLVDG